ncbi:MAG TPA: hypothetical protein VGC13_03085 [Longimicrobium sp.]
MMKWPRRGPETTLYWTFGDERALLETGWDGRTGELADVTLVTPGPIARMEHAPPPAFYPTAGIPRCDPGEWVRRTSRGMLNDFADHYVREPLPVRTELGPDHLLVRIGGGGEAAVSEMVSGRLRAGLSAAQSLLWICVGGFSAAERAMLEEHVAYSHAPPSSPAPAPDGWKARIRKVFGRGDSHPFSGA